MSESTTFSLPLFKAKSPDSLFSSVKGDILMPGNDGYESAKTVWNGMINRNPAVIIRCQSTEDIVHAVNFARENEMAVSVRGGGHSLPGYGVCDGGVMIDLSLMNKISIDAEKKIAVVEGGALLRDFDKVAQEHGLAATGGTISHTGVGGLTLGGGQGWLQGKFGLACDNLLEAEMILADGTVVRTSEENHPDLFWAIRGGGGNFGIVARFVFQLHELGPTILGGMIVYPRDQAKEILQFFREFSMDTPDEMMAIAGILTTPDGIPAIAIAPGWIGDHDKGWEYMNELKQTGTPLVDLVGEIPYVEQQKLMDAAVPHGLERYLKMGYFPQLPDELIDILVKNAAIMESPHSVILLATFKGKSANVSPEATAFYNRRRQWHFDILAQWTNPEEREKHLKWSQQFWKEVEPFTKGAGVNFLDFDDGHDRTRTVYGSNYDRLVLVKRKYDPANFFRMNSNINTGSYVPLVYQLCRQVQC